MIDARMGAIYLGSKVLPFWSECYHTAWRYRSIVTSTTYEAGPSAMPLPVQSFAVITDLGRERALLELHME